MECRSGLFLAVTEGGVIQGISDSESPATIFFLIPVGLRVVALQNEATSGYIAMNSEGRIYTTVSTVKNTQNIRLFELLLCKVLTVISFVSAFDRYSGVLHARVPFQRVRI